MLPDSMATALNHESPVSVLTVCPLRCTRGVVLDQFDIGGEEGRRFDNHAAAEVANPRWANLTCSSFGWVTDNTFWRRAIVGSWSAMTMPSIFSLRARDECY